MMTVRPNVDLFKLLRTGPQTSDEVSYDPLGDWYANAALSNGKPYIAVVSSVTRFAVVVDALPYASFLTRLPGTTHQTLIEIGISKARAITIVKGMQEVRLGRAFDRSILSNAFRL